MKIKIGKYPKGDGHRKISIEIDNFDTWNMDSTLAMIIYPMLMQLKETKHGIPSSFSKSSSDSYPQETFDFYAEGDDDAFDRSIKEWEEILDKMIWSFQQLAFDDYQDKYFHGKTNFDWKISDHLFKNPLTGKQEKTYEMIDNNPSGHFFDGVGLELHEKRIQEGLDLFAKYYRNLWD